ncbi:alpha/beta-Hydrolases superfamily protein [Artemisia annua]|uniref:Alpha/beta-Hydrolases superfamily protein n=1 Tax=Artemisia annua TaxID=35608 RepID=A0A2U1MBE9_ARTAN|nr:alpha/beta-Hydrolases superfamily protein [Artemisia annua]
MCFGSNNYGVETVDQVDENGNVDMTSANGGGGDGHKCPTHLVVMVNGLIGSAHNWRYAAKQFLKNYPEDIIVHCSERNSSLLTFNGVDVMGCRLANEVISVIKRHPNLQKISFIGHSLGGLIARYAIAKLYTNDTINNHGSESISSERIAGLVPINFITVATPHLGTGGHRQVPMFGGSNTVEKVAHQISWVLGRTGRHLFLTDKARGNPPLLLQMVNDCEDLKFFSALQSFKRHVTYANAHFDRRHLFLTDKARGNPPLLLQMVNDCEDLKFFSALQSFKRHVTYANAHFDHIVGWSTSSIRRRNELPQRKQLLRSGKYPHILKGDVSTITQGSSIELKVNSFKTATASMEETMIRGLTKISWERVDVSFKGSKQRYFAHNTIQVNTPWMNSDGADIIQHIVDNFHL